MQDAPVPLPTIPASRQRWRDIGDRAWRELSRRIGHEELDYSVIDGVTVLWGSCPQRRPAAEIQRALTRLRRTLPQLDEHGILFCADQRYFRAVVDREGTMIELEHLSATAFEDALEQVAASPQPRLTREMPHPAAARASEDPAPAAPATAPVAAHPAATARSAHG